MTPRDCPDLAAIRHTRQQIEAQMSTIDDLIKQAGLDARVGAPSEQAADAASSAAMEVMRHRLDDATKLLQSRRK